MNMEMQFEFTEKNGGACVTKVLSPGAACVIPERLGGLPVTELADRAFAGSRISEVFLPEGLKRIGRYCFYGCEDLRTIHLYSSATEIGGGFLNGCRAVREIYMHMDSTERSALRDFVTELNERITVHYFLPGPNGEETEAARLIFPIYYDEAVENTPARITVSNIHGTGQKYRYCFEDKKVQFDRYDKLFVYEKAEEPVTSAAEIAIYRLMYPHGLRDEAKRGYEEFVRENLYEILLANLGQAEVFKWLAGRFLDEDVASGGAGFGYGAGSAGWGGVSGQGVVSAGAEHGAAASGDGRGHGLSRDELDALILEASKRRLAEISALLMDIKRRRFPVKRKTFDF